MLHYRVQIGLYTCSTNANWALLPRYYLALHDKYVPSTFLNIHPSKQYIHCQFLENLSQIQACQSPIYTMSWTPP